MTHLGPPMSHLGGVSIRRVTVARLASMHGLLFSLLFPFFLCNSSYSANTSFPFWIIQSILSTANRRPRLKLMLEHRFRLSAVLAPFHVFFLQSPSRNEKGADVLRNCQQHSPSKAFLFFAWFMVSSENGNQFFSQKSIGHQNWEISLHQVFKKTFQIKPPCFGDFFCE